MITKLILSGCTGAMGKVIIDALKYESSLKIVAGISTSVDVKFDFPVYNRFSNIVEEADMIIDFSNKYLLDDILEFADRKNLKLVLASTGYSGYDEEKIFALSKKIAIFRSSNMSYGVHLMLKLTEYAVKLFGKDYEIELIEEHGGKKIDAPSGTVKMILNSIKNNVDYNPNIIYNREGILNGRKKTDIGIHSIRGGGLIANHIVMFVGDGDVIKIEHNTLSKEIYAKGAINAAKFIVDKKKGYYKFEDLV